MTVSLSCGVSTRDPFEALLLFKILNLAVVFLMIERSRDLHGKMLL